MLVGWVVGRSISTFEVIYGGLHAGCLVDFRRRFPIYVAYDSLGSDVDERIARFLCRLLTYTVNDRLFYIAVRSIILNRILFDFVCCLIEIARRDANSFGVRLSVEFRVAQDCRLYKDIDIRRFNCCLVSIVSARLCLNDR